MRFMYALLICGSRVVGVLVWGLCIHYSYVGVGL